MAKTKKGAEEICKKYDITNFETDMTTYGSATAVSIDLKIILSDEPECSIQDLYSFLSELDSFSVYGIFGKEDVELRFIADESEYTFSKLASTIFKDDEFLYCAETDDKEENEPMEMKEGLKERYIYSTTYGEGSIYQSYMFTDSLREYSKKVYVFCKPENAGYLYVTMRYWDDENNCETEGYVSDIRHSFIGPSGPSEKEEPTTAYKGYVPKPSKDDYKDYYDDDYDPYYANEYNDPEDFYYDYYDDFVDFEEAYDYYYDHVD